jgi:hypothetical protein
MRLALTAAVVACLSLPAASQDGFLKGDQLKAAIERDCADGCVTFNQQEASELERQIEALVARKMKEAFDAGVQHQKAACPSLI